MSNRTITIRSRRAATRTPSLWKGALAGLIGGLAGAAAQRLGERVFPPQRNGREAPSIALAERVTGHALSLRQKKAVQQGAHWTYGAIAGAVYGAAVEFEPGLAARHGAAFGLGLNGVTSEEVLPMLGIATNVKEQSRQESWREAASLALYGVVTETVRRMIRGR